MDQEFKIFVVEDDEWYRELLGYNLELNPDYVVTKFGTATDFLHALHEKPDVVTLDYRLPDMEGGEVLKRIKDYDPEIEVIVISEQENIETAVNLLKLGAYDYLVKAKDIRDRLLNLVNNIRKNASLKTRLNTLQQEVGQKYKFEKSIIGQSPAIKKVFALLEKAIKTNITVTITGETGTGKELVAKAIHFSSKRRDHPFVPVNVAAIPKDLVESELFGHEKGAFTGANIRRIGKFEQAHKGTLFLDEIGDMEMSMQVKLLRALQEKEIVRIGGNKTVKTDCRILVATHRNLLEEVKAGNFREDLYYRLFGLPIELPPLRERGNDILLLAKHFLVNFCKENELPDLSLSTQAQKKLLAYNYPGNVRELRSVVELAAVMANGEEITEDEISFGSNDVLPDVLSEELTLREYTYRIINLYLKKYENDIKLVANKLDIGQSTIYRMLKEMKAEA
jgi:two-component system response regulator AtoC